MEEVKKHNKKTDMWFIWRGKVLDVTKFLDEHPGGPDVLLEVAGADSTSGFEDIGHSAEAISLAEGLVIGTVQGAKVPHPHPCPLKRPRLFYYTILNSS